MKSLSRALWRSLPIIVFWWLLVGMFVSVPTIPWGDRLPLIVAAGPLMSLLIVIWQIIEGEEHKQ